jgi:hypothetical protein
LVFLGLFTQILSAPSAWRPANAAFLQIDTLEQKCIGKQTLSFNSC